MRQPVMYANSTAGRIAGGRCARIRSICSRSKKPVRTFRSLSIGTCGTCINLPFCQVEDSFQRGQLAIDLAVGIPPLSAFLAFADAHQRQDRARQHG